MEMQAESQPRKQSAEQQRRTSTADDEFDLKVLVGKYVSVFWEQDKYWYAGVIDGWVSVRVVCGAYGALSDGSYGLVVSGRTDESTAGVCVEAYKKHGA